MQKIPIIGAALAQFAWYKKFTSVNFLYHFALQRNKLLGIPVRPIKQGFFI
jgi:hypothetical protein